MRKKVLVDITERISDQMSKLSRKLTPEQRKANGEKAWRTRLKNLANNPPRTS